MNFIDLMGSTTLTDAQINKRLDSLERKKYSKRSEKILNRVGTGSAMGKRPMNQKENDSVDEFNYFMFSMETLAGEIRYDNQLLIDAMSYDRSLKRLELFIILDGQLPEFPPAPEYVEETILNENGDLETVLIRNPLVVADEQERGTAQEIIDNASQEIIDLAYLRAT